MNKKNKQIFLLVILIGILFTINYHFIDNLSQNNLEIGFVERIIDGDTIVINDESIRFLGINTPERGENYYSEAKDFLEDLVLNKSVGLESYGRDKYDRRLAYVFLGRENINIELVKEGFANVYILDEKKYEKQLRDAWEDCIESNENLCEKSKDKWVNCIELKNVDYKSGEVVLYNKCDFECDLDGWEIKEEGRGKVIVNESIESNGYLDIKTEDMWEKTGDTLFLRDDVGKLVLYYGY